jgi:hypothetical protein
LLNGMKAIPPAAMNGGGRAGRGADNDHHR